MPIRTDRQWLRTIRRGTEYVVARTPLVKHAYWRYAPSYYRWQFQRRLDHDPPLDPLKTVWIDPDDISRFSSREQRTEDRWQDIARVSAGIWDQEPLDRSETLFDAERIEDTVLYKSFERHFIHGVSWENTVLVQSVNEQISGGEVWRGCQSQADVVRRCHEMDMLYDRIRTDGYKTQQELFAEGHTRSDRVGYLDLLTDEITIDIGRNGELLFVDGRHRACLAKIMDLSSVPVFILTRHQQWLDRRATFYQSGIPSSLTGHPDLVELQ